MPLQIEISRKDLCRQNELLELRDKWTEAMSSFLNGHSGCAFDRASGGSPYLRIDVKNTGSCPVRMEIARIAHGKFLELMSDVVKVIDDAMPMRVSN